MASPTQWTWVWENSRDSEGQGCLACWSPRGCKELDMTERLNNKKKGLHQTYDRSLLQVFARYWTWWNGRLSSKLLKEGISGMRRKGMTNYESGALEGHIQEIRWTAKSWWNLSTVLWRQISTNDRNQHGTLDKFSSQDFARFSGYMRWEANELNKIPKGQTESPIVFKCWKEIDLPSYPSEVQVSHTLRKKSKR